MSYIGKTPTVGNFQVCDAISTVNNQAAYTMQVGSVNVSPESANHMIVSLNGVIQKPIDAFTVSGSTITFASNLVTGDVINFIQILGNVLDLGVPSDSTVSLAKLTATGTKNSTTFLRGDNTFATAGLTGVTTDSGNVTITDGNLTFGGAGHGVHLGVTSATAANLLDDYEEGTFTPTFVNQSGGEASNYTNNSTGSYIKIGKMVYANVSWNMGTISTGPGSLYAGIGGFPFVSDVSAGGCPWYTNIDVPDGPATFQISNNYNYGIFYSQRDNNNYNTISPGAIASNDNFQITFVYKTD